MAVEFELNPGGWRLNWESDSRESVQERLDTEYFGYGEMELSKLLS